MKVLPFSIGAAGLLGLFSPATLAAPLRCDISQKQQCQSTTGCIAVPAKVFNLVDLSLSAYSRCEEAGCDSYNAAFSRSGAFINIEIPQHGMLAKLDLETLKFLEVVTLTTDVVYVSWGNCSEVTG